MKKKIKTIYASLKKHQYINLYLLIVIIFSLFIFSPFVLKYINGDDTAFHLANIVARSDILFDIPGVIIPRIGNNLGYAVGLFYPSFPHAMGAFILAFISHIGFNAVAALKLVKLLIILSSGIFMYLLASKIFNNNLKGLYASIFYITSSYFFTDIFERDALNECCVFSFIPLIILGLYYLFSENNKKLFYICFIGGYVGLMYSHLVMAVWFTLILLIGLLVFLNDILKKQIFFPLLISAIIILLLTSTFTVPMLEHLVLGNYAIESQNKSSLGWTVLLESYYKFRPIGTGNNWLLLQLQFCVLILCAFAIYKLIKRQIPKKRIKFIFMFLVFTIISFLFSVIDILWLYIPDFLKNLQFQWRLATYVSFGTSLLAVEGLDSFLNIFKDNIVKYIKLLIIALSVVAFLTNLSLAKFYIEIPYDISISGMGWHREYLPQNAYNNMKYFDNRNSNEIIVLKGSADIHIIENDVPRLEFTADNVSKNTYVELPRLYYLGYKIIDENGNNIKYKEDKKGFISIHIDDGKYKVYYVGTIGYRIAFVIKTIVLVFIVLVLIKWFVVRKI